MRDRITRGPVAPRGFTTVPQLAVDTFSDRLAPLARFALPANATLDARLLVITADGTDPAYLAIAETLRLLGTPFDVFNASLEPDLTPDRLATGNHGRYYGVILDRGNLSTGTVSAFSPAEWAVLGDYEALFQVRRVALYAYPEVTYGLLPSDPIDTTITPLTIHCPDTGAAVFADTSCSAGIAVKDAYAYPATATDANTVPILVDDSGRIFGAISTDASNHEYLALTFAQSPSLTHSLALIYDVVRWVTRGVFLGERHAYLASQIDDLFLASDIYPYCSDCVTKDAGADGAAIGEGTVATIGDGGSVDGLTYRITDLDLQALADWQLVQRGHPVSTDLHFDWALNGAGTAATDPLTLRAQALGPAFNWISHTWDHADLDTINYADALVEFVSNDSLVASLGLQPFDVRNIVTPSISGLDNPEAMRAAFDAGIRFMVSDTSIPGQDNPSPNAGFYSPEQSQILIIPRRPTNLFYNVSTPDKWQQEYNDIYRAYWKRDLSYAEILDFESDVLVQYLLLGENDPWMFHQANARDYGGGRSLLSDLHDSVLAKYAALSKLPIASGTMNVLGGRVAARMVYDQSQAAAVIGPGAQITVSVVAAASVPVTGLCTPSAETYAGQKISYLALAAGAQVTLQLSGCNEGPDAGVIGSDASDAGQANDASGFGGADGTGGAVGVADGAVDMGTGGDLGVGGATVMGSGGAAGTGAAGMGGDLGVGGAMAMGSGGAIGSGGAADMGMGGDVGTGGAPGTGGAGSGGATGSGGDLGVGGAAGEMATGGVGGTVADAGPIVLDASPIIPDAGPFIPDANPIILNVVSPASGCSCSLAEKSPGTSALGLALAMIAVVSRRRKRARGSSTRH